MAPPERASSEPRLLPPITATARCGEINPRPAKPPLRSVSGVASGQLGIRNRSASSIANGSSAEVPGEPVGLSSATSSSSRPHTPSASSGAPAQKPLLPEAGPHPHVPAAAQPLTPPLGESGAPLELSPWPQSAPRVASKGVVVKKRRSKKRASTISASSGAPPAPVAPRPKLWYVAQFGNNSPLFRSLMRTRPGWAAGPGDPGNLSGKTDYEEKRVKVQVSDDAPEIQFLWTQYTEPKFVEAIAEQQPGICVTLNEEYKMTLKQKNLKPETPPCTIPRIHNHFEGNDCLCTKRGLCESMKRLFLGRGRDPFGAIPLTFVLRNGSHDEQFDNFRRAFRDIEASNNQRMWLVKPGEWANRGCGIRIFDSIEEVADRVDSKEKVWIVQKYMENPFLIHRRKFDIRSYLLVTEEPGSGVFHAFHYNQSYLRTVSAEFSTDTLDRMVHLSNGPVQDKGQDYGKYETANKLSLDEFQRYINEHHAKDGFRVQENLIPQMEALMADAISSAVDRLNPRGVDHCFEIYGFDFMVDANFRPWLIEVNTNPGLEANVCALLGRIIPKMLEEALRLTIDRTFPHAAAPAPVSGSNQHRSSKSSSKSVKEPKDPTSGTGWKQIWSSADSDKALLACDWVSSLPPGSEVDVPLLGRDILGLSQKKQK